jgi:uncharacterized damage-inducible protein DinB
VEYHPERDHSVEPWLRGPKPGVPFFVAPLFFSFEHVREEIRKHVADLTPEQIWKKIGNAAPLGFHLRHIPGSVDRLLTYLEGNELTEAQLQSLKNESQPGPGFEDLFQSLDAGLKNAEERLLKLDPGQLDSTRFVGRKRLQVTAHGLLVHVAEHTQRHLGQAITTAKMLKGISST